MSLFYIWSPKLFFLHALSPANIDWKKSVRVCACERETDRAYVLFFVQEIKKTLGQSKYWTRCCSIGVGVVLVIVSANKRMIKQIWFSPLSPLIILRAKKMFVEIKRKIKQGGIGFGTLMTSQWQCIFFHVWRFLSQMLTIFIKSRVNECLFSSITANWSQMMSQRGHSNNTWHSKGEGVDKVSRELLCCFKIWF